MKLRRRTMAALTAVVTVVTFGLIGTTPAGAVTTFNVANDHVTCNTLTGTITFATALKNSGAATGANTVTVKGTVGGCTDSDDGFIKMFKGTISSTINTNNGNSCTGLLGPSTISGSATIVWTPAAGQNFIPKTTIGTAQKAASLVSFSQVSGGVFTVPASETPWGSSYGKFQLGAQYGLAPLSTTVDFTGGDGGATGWFEGLTQQDVGNLGNSCGSLAGLKTLSFGIGAVHGG